MGTWIVYPKSPLMLHTCGKKWSRLLGGISADFVTNTRAAGIREQEVS